MNRDVRAFVLKRLRPSLELLTQKTVYLVILHYEQDLDNIEITQHPNLTWAVRVAFVLLAVGCEAGKFLEWNAVTCIRILVAFWDTHNKFFSCIDVVVSRLSEMKRVEKF